MKRLLIIGAGGHGRSVAEAILAEGKFRISGFLDDIYPGTTRVWDFPILGKMTQFGHWCEVADFAVVAIGNNALRQRIFGELTVAGFKLATVIHPRAVVSPTATIGDGSVIMAGAIIGAEACLGKGVVVNCAAVVDHHCRVDDFGHLGVTAAMSGGSVLGASAWMQAGAILGYAVEIEAGRVLMSGESIKS